METEKFVIEFFSLVILFALVLRLDKRDLNSLIRKLIDRILGKR